MSGLGVFLSALLGGTKAVGRAIENKKMKDYTYKVNENGQATWLDFDANQYVNGEKLVPKLERKPDGQLYRLEVGKNSGKVYVDPYENIMSRMDKENLNRKAMAEKYGRLTYQKYHREYHCSVSTEMATDKIIICIYGSDYTKVYRKWYLKYQTLDKYNTHPDPDENDFGVPITKEEYDKLSREMHTYSTIPTLTLCNKLGTEEDPYYDVKAKKQINL